MTDTLRCSVCSREVRIVRLNARTLALGHVVNPKNQMHPVRLSRPALASAGSRVPTRSMPADFQPATGAVEPGTPHPAPAPVGAGRSTAGGG